MGILGSGDSGGDSSGKSSFEGRAGRLAGAVMTRLNRDMELAAIVELCPAEDGRVLAVGFGPGVGVAELVPRVPRGGVAGVDPSATMVEQACRRNRAAVASGRVRLERASAASIPWPGGSFDGVIAVNSLQLWKPIHASLRELARILAPSGTLVTLTHGWAIEKRAPETDWVSMMTEALAVAGFVRISHRTARFRSGEGLFLRAERPSPGGTPN